MTPGPISKRVVADRLATGCECLEEIRRLPLKEPDAFFADRRSVWTAESCLRRAPEALFDVGRHIVAKGFGVGVSDDKGIVARLQERAVSPAEASTGRVLAGYRNRLVHFYHEVTQAELYEVCARRLGDVESIEAAYRRWMASHGDQVDEPL